VRVELQRPAVLCHRPYHLVTGSFRKVRSNLKSDRDIGADLAHEVRDYFLGNPAGNAADTGWIQRDSSKEPSNGRHRLTNTLFPFGGTINRRGAPAFTSGPSAS
jgi:hypothetical protein